MMLNCGHPAHSHTGISPGHGHLLGCTMCYACMHIDQLSEMLWGTRLFAYQGANGEVTNWPGGPLGKITRKMITGNGQLKQLRVWMVDIHGQRWYGMGPTESGTYLRLRKITTSR